MTSTDQIQITRGPQAGLKLKLGARLGEGSFGVVFAASAPGVEAAVKFHDPEAADLPPNELQERFERECELALKLHRVDSQRFPAVLGTGYDDRAGGDQFLVMEKANGGSLADYLADHPDLNLTQRLELALEMVACVAALHARGWAHRDIKPDNFLVFIDKKGKPSLKNADLSGLTRKRWTSEMASSIENVSPYEYEPHDPKETDIDQLSTALAITISTKHLKRMAQCGATGTSMHAVMGDLTEQQEIAHKRLSMSERLLDRLFGARGLSKKDQALAAQLEEALTSLEERRFSKPLAATYKAPWFTTAGRRLPHASAPERTRAR